MKVELGGGTNPKGDGYVNVDIISSADIVFDVESGPLPFDDDSVDSIYSAHCLEHIKDPFAIFRQILRVCKIGAEVEIHLPHWLHAMAMCPGHLHTISDRLIERVLEYPETFFSKQSTRKKFREVDRRYQIESTFHQLRRKFPELTDEEVARYIPDCCHEVHFKMEVVSWK